MLLLGLWWGFSGLTNCPMSWGGGGELRGGIVWRGGGHVLQKGWCNDEGKDLASCFHQADHAQPLHSHMAMWGLLISSMQWQSA